MNGASHELFNIKLRTCLDTGWFSDDLFDKMFYSYNQLSPLL